MPCMFDGLHAIGVDETSRRKGHAYITVIVDHGRGRVIWAHDGHGRQVLDLFFRQLTPERRASIRIVTGDGAGRIDSSVARHRRLCPKSCANVVWPVVGCGLSALTAWCHRAGTCPGSGAWTIGWR